MTMSIVTSIKTVGSKKVLPRALRFVAGFMSINGPITAPGSNPSATFIAPAVSERRFVKASWTPSCTRMRIAVFRSDGTPAAISISESSKTMNGALPPSSIEVFLIVATHCSISSLPTSVEPAKVNLHAVGSEPSERRPPGRGERR
jgi:hypothetical protein